jgi:hypothetical protein
MTHEATVDGGTGREEQVSLPRRADARRCSYTERGERRCVLPPDHELEHVLPHQKTSVMCPDD